MHQSLLFKVVSDIRTTDGGGKEINSDQSHFLSSDAGSSKTIRNCLSKEKITKCVLVT